MFESRGSDVLILLSSSYKHFPCENGEFAFFIVEKWDLFCLNEQCSYGINHLVVTGEA